jgi:hypothetical protein
MPVHWLADPDKSGQTVHSAGFASAFTLSQSRQRILPQTVVDHTISFYIKE